MPALIAYCLLGLESHWRPKEKTVTKLITTSFFAITLALTATTSIQAHESHQEAGKNDMTNTMSAPDIASEMIAENFYILTGPGGNVGVSAGEDGLYVIDDKFSRFADQILFRIREISDEPVRFVLNTHLHGDHSGGNAEMKETGATVFAHDNVRSRMVSNFEKNTPDTERPAPGDEVWPSLTFSETATLHFNGQTATAHHVPNAHTDGDSLVVFMPANIVHMGDNYFNGLFPFVDIDSGGNLEGMIAAQDKVLSMVDDETKIIPGHGPMATKADLQKSRDILSDILAQVRTAKDSGMSVEEVLAAVTLNEYKELSAFIDQKGMVRQAYRSLEK